jgi:hypothetical protein
MPRKRSVLKSPVTATGRGVRGSGRGGRHGTRDNGGDTGNPSSEDFRRLAKMLARINVTLGNLINEDHGVLDPKLRAQFIRTWPQAANNLTQAIRRLHEEAIQTPSAVHRANPLSRQLGRAGLTGDMLRMKEESLDFYLNPVDQVLTQPLTGKESWGEKAVTKLLTWTKPAFKVMNSILGSLLKAFPGMEVVKELKEHIEAGYEIAGAKAEDRQ